MDPKHETVELFKAFEKEELQQRVSMEGSGWCYCLYPDSRA